MKIKSLSVLLSLLLIAVLPFTAYAVGPASDESDNPVIADDGAPYVTTTITDNDRGHIATTAYVKGAYNDTIAAVNAVNDMVERISDNLNCVAERQVKIYTTWGGNGTTQVELVDPE